MALSSASALRSITSTTVLFSSSQTSCNNEFGRRGKLWINVPCKRAGAKRSLGASAGARASIDPVKLAADIQQSRPTGRGEELVGPGDSTLEQPGSLQSSMAEEIDQIADEGGMSSEGNLAQSDVEPAESPAVQEAADRAAGGTGDVFKGSRLISAADGPQPSDEPAYRPATKKVVDVEAEKEGDVFRGSKLISTDDSPSGSPESSETPSTKGSSTSRTSSVSSEGNVAQSDVVPAESPAVQRAADRAAEMSSEGNLAQSDVEPAETEAVERAADKAAGGAEDVKASAQEGLEKGERAVKETAAEGEEAAKGAFAKAKEVASGVVEAVRELDDPEKLAQKIPEPVKEGLLDATLLKEYVQEKTENLVHEFKGQVDEAKVDDKAKEVVQQVKQAAGGASDSGKGKSADRHHTSQEGNLAESDIAPAESDAIERTADALSHKQREKSADPHRTSQEGNLAESDVAPAESDAIERTADSLMHKQQGNADSNGHSTSQEGNLAESDVAPAQSAAVEHTADSLAHKQQAGGAAVDSSPSSRENAVKTRVQQKLGPTSTTDDVGSNKHTLEVIEAHEKLKNGQKAGRPGAVGFQKETKERTATFESSKKLEEAKSVGRIAAAVFEGEAKERVKSTGGELYK